MMVLATGTVIAPIPVTMLNVLVRLGRMKVRPAAARPSPMTVYCRRQRGMRDSRFCAPLMAMYRFPSWTAHWLTSSTTSISPASPNKVKLAKYLMLAEKSGWFDSTAIR